MEEKKVTVDGWIDNYDNVYINAKDIANKLAELEGVQQKNEGIVIENTPFKRNINNIINGEYDDGPDYVEFEEYEHGLLSKISMCISDKTRIIGRRSKRGISR